MVEVVDVEEAVTPEQVSEFELSILGHLLPDEYKQFLFSYNGGSPKPSGFKFYLKDSYNPDEAVIAWFLALYNGEYENITKFFHTFRSRIPLNMLAVARDPGGSLVLLGLEGEHRGKVYFWLQELEGGDGESPTYDNVAFVADGFNEFLDNLAELEE